jgi:transposase-like protein
VNWITIGRRRRRMQLWDGAKLETERFQDPSIHPSRGRQRLYVVEWGKHHVRGISETAEYFGLHRNSVSAWKRLYRSAKHRVDALHVLEALDHRDRRIKVVSEQRELDVPLNSSRDVESRVGAEGRTVDIDRLDRLIEVMRDRGSSKYKIAAELTERGILVSPTTVLRRLRHMNLNSRDVAARSIRFEEWRRRSEAKHMA